MKYPALLAFALLALAGCKNDPKDAPDTTGDTENTAVKTPAFTNKIYEKKSTLPCKDVCTYVTIDVPEASGAGVASDSINQGVFNVVRSIVYFGEKPKAAKNYQEIMDSFIGDYDDLKKKFPQEAMPWEAKIKGTVDYESDKLINIKLNNYMFTGGAHGYESDRSLIFDRNTGKLLKRNDIFKDEKAFTALTEKKFREKYKIPAGKSINSTGFMFLEDRFKLPDEIFFRNNGVLLLYNTMEVAANAEGRKEVLMPYAEVEQMLKVK